jgi:uncharacterized protein (DUF302 family)
VKVKSAYSVSETIERLKKDIAAKGIMFFSEIDQSKLAANAGVKLRPSTLLVFGNPPLGTLFLTSNPNSGLDWPVRLLVIQDEKGDVYTVIPTSTGSRSATTSRTARSSSTPRTRWRRGSRRACRRSRNRRAAITRSPQSRVFRVTATSCFVK